MKQLDGAGKTEIGVCRCKDTSRRSVLQKLFCSLCQWRRRFQGLRLVEQALGDGREHLLQDKLQISPVDVTLDLVSGTAFGRS